MTGMIGSKLVGLAGGKIQIYAIVFLLVSTLVLGFTTYKMIQKNGAQKQEIGELKADIINMKKEMDLKDAMQEQSKISELKAQQEKIELENKYKIEKKQLNEVIKKLKDEVATKTDEEKKSIECLDRVVPKPIIDQLFGVQ